MSASELLPHILDLASRESEKLPQGAREMAKLSLFDWMTVSLAGACQPLGKIIRDFVLAERGVEVAAVIGETRRLPARAAALANGTISHALDYDDTHFAYIGHPSVAIFPAALAVAEEVKASVHEMVDAFLVGAEATCRIGIVLGRNHYDAGFHQTATSGAFGATIAASRLYRLDRKSTSMALGLVSTRASGLKSQFGTMGKPFNAGAAAANGVEAAGLARLGFEASQDVFSGPQSFMIAHHASINFEADVDWGDIVNSWQMDKFVFADVRHKLHACCHGAHAMVEALLKLQVDHQFNIDEIVGVQVKTAPRWLNVCDIKVPRTGLEIKFSYIFLAAMVLRGSNLAAYETYDDAVCNDVVVQALAAKVHVIGDKAIADSASFVQITLNGRRKIENSFDLLAPIDVGQLTLRLKSKAAGLIGAKKAERIWSSIYGDEGILASDIADYLQS